MSTIKGSALRSARVWLQSELGPDLATFIESSPSDLQLLLRGQVILAGSKYPRARLHEMFEQMAKHWPKEVMTKLDRLGAYIASEDLGGVYRVLLKLGSVDGTLRVLAGVWGRYFDEGRATLIGTQPYDYTFEVIDPSLHPMHPRLIAGYVRRAVELAGAKSATVEHQVGARADQHLFLVRWRSA